MKKNVMIFGLEVEDLRAMDVKDLYGVHALQEALKPWEKFILGNNGLDEIDYEKPI
jgi:hypothetical protein